MSGTIIMTAGNLAYLSPIVGIFFSVNNVRTVSVIYNLFYRLRCSVSDTSQSSLKESEAYILFYELARG